MRTPWNRGLAAPLLVACGLAGTFAPRAVAQVTSLPLDLVDVADDPLAPDDCHVQMTTTDTDPIYGTDTCGVSIADFNNDGLLDIFFPASKNVANKLYKNLGGLTFVDVAPASGVANAISASAAALFVDYDHDGDLDLWVVQHLGKPGNFLGPRFKLFRNQGAAGGYVFSDVTLTAGFLLQSTPKGTNFGWVSGICAGDYDRDGYVDLFASWNANTISVNDQWRLLRNAPNPTPGDPLDPNYSPRVFVDATPNSGLQLDFSPGEPWQPQFWDVNRDGWPDLHIAQDFGLDVMAINNHDGTFTDVATTVGLNGNPAENRNEMGSALGDPDNDLDQDLHLTNRVYLDRFYRNDSVAGTLSFADAAVATGLNDTPFGWGDTFFDMDNDSDLDQADVSGADHDPTLTNINKVRMNLFPEKLGDGITGKWADVTALLPEFSQPPILEGQLARGLAAGDLDRDGDVDLVVTRDDGLDRVMKNTLVSTNSWFEVDLVNTAGSLDTTGSRVFVKQGSVTQMREVITGSSYLCQESPRLHFGLGIPNIVGSIGSTPLGGGLTVGPAQTASAHPRAFNPLLWLVVRWSDNGNCQIVMHPTRNTILTVVRSAVSDTGDMNADGHLTAVDQAMLLLATQNPAGFEATYPLSPGMIVGDVDNNGLVDAADLAAWSVLPPH